MESRNSIEKGNFGLTSISRNKEKLEFDNWFWESKAKKKIKEQEKQAQIERMRAETAAMQQLLSEDQPKIQSNSMDVGKIAMIGGVVILLGIGAVVMLKKKKPATVSSTTITTEGLLV